MAMAMAMSMRRRAEGRSAHCTRTRMGVFEPIRLLDGDQRTESAGQARAQRCGSRIEHGKAHPRRGGDRHECAVHRRSADSKHVDNSKRQRIEQQRSGQFRGYSREQADGDPDDGEAAMPMGRTRPLPPFGDDPQTNRAAQVPGHRSRSGRISLAYGCRGTNPHARALRRLEVRFFFFFASMS
jgi:hypothetical protein